MPSKALARKTRTPDRRVRVDFAPAPLNRDRVPELPEVEVGRKLLERVAVGRRIAAVECAEDPLVFEGIRPGAVEAALLGAQVLSAHRHGKHLWLALDRRPWPLFHFGMTGAFRTPNEAPLPLERGIVDLKDQWPPRFMKLRLVLDDGGELVMTNARRLGRIRLRADPWSEPPLSELGFDPYTGLPRLSEFRARLAGRAVAVKGLLLDQSFAAGVGNWLADEILFQARLDPRQSAAHLSEQEVRRLYQKMKCVVAKAVSVDADKARFPRTWLFHHRWGKRAKARVAGHAVEHITVAGRTTAWVPALQRRTEPGVP